MLRQTIHEITIPTSGRGFTELTREVATLVRQSGLQVGLVTLHLRHTSASLLIQENADPEVRRDLERFIHRLAPDGDPLFQHTCEGLDDMPAHIRTALTAVNLRHPNRARKYGAGQLAGNLPVGAPHELASPSTCCAFTRGVSRVRWSRFGRLMQGVIKTKKPRNCWRNCVLDAI